MTQADHHGHGPNVAAKLGAIHPGFFVLADTVNSSKVNGGYRTRNPIPMKTRVANATLADALDERTVVAAPELCRVEGERLRCLACGHRCLIGDGLRGICKVRFNDGGRLKVPFGYVAGLQCDPVEKKPFFHVYPSSDALTFGMMGCDLHCSYCQNWVTSQALRDSAAVAPVRPIRPAQLVESAQREGARLVVSSYNEPLITAEWAVGVFREAKAAGLACAFVSNGNATPEVLDFLRPWIIAYKVDLKSFDDRHYRSLGGALDNITRTIRLIHERGLWLEIVTLVISGFNDDVDELRRAADFLVSISPDIPWHVTAFHADYKMTDTDSTSPETLIRAAEIGTAAGMRFVYAGNLPGRVGPWEDTRCPGCRVTLIERFGYLVRSYRITADGRCPKCRTRIPGVWPTAATEVRTGNDMDAYRSRLPRALPVIGSLDRGERGTTVPRDYHGGLSSPARHADPRPSTGGSAVTSPAARLSLSEEQQPRLVSAVAAMLRAAVAGQPAAFPLDLPDLGDQLVGGAFICVKRGRHLRSCCGILGPLIPLRQALEHAAARTAREDGRFPPISPTEVDFLDMDVWLLGPAQAVQARGEERLGAITVGKHGVQVVRGAAHGLFLPSVAIDNGWDVRQFLDRVCAKAELPPTAWREDDTSLFTFEGESLRGSLGGGEGAPAVERPRGFLRTEDLATYAQFCRRELITLLTGGTPSYYMWGVPDGNVNGVVLLLQRPGIAGVEEFSHVSMRAGVPLQATLSALIQAAARHVASRAPRPDLLAALQVGLAVLRDPVLHGTVADPELSGLEVRTRALIVLERNKSALLHDPWKSAEELLAEAASGAQVTHPASAAVFSLEVLTTATPVSASSVPRPVRGPAIRPPTAAGTFYEADPAALAVTVDGLLAGADAATSPGAEDRPAALVPHAGLRFSGRIAAAVLKRLRIPGSVIVIGPKHTPFGTECAVAPQQTWALPGGEVQSDFVLVRQLCQAIPGLEMDAAAHQREHAIEVELPLLARLAPEAKVVGIVIGHGDLDSCRRFAEGLAGILRKRKERPLLLISSDMNHFASDAENRRLDEMAIAALLTGDPERLYQTVTRNSISMCGVLPAVIVLETLRLLGTFRRADRVAYATSADVTGDTSRVVGYAGMLIG
jgi:AmmeMemoRadiSam system radical SAM enzyme/AmmeMemoRadiSam system protein B/AmmeMemoRadiSam system protein A